ncbi:MAG: SH3 domain-containing protein [Gammaproteobacteria bacterium]|jgi:TPR repeat protein|nr:SH3 domain-containing protein [Gammaproteobacteria bacterium]MBT3722124.1 SH3 domain-containing protein [Gammaproteobacteria bacterium]MBT4194625.1 SH3 domain-containing protein [Gammaproteobacteria bacterium]MBT4448899.1 SH3 domain-containing protein [Gammaproteobacteria bacterium]MBT4863129.1 SH3 domain-containing protein [Gammaproteobacteria bacterium]
MTSVFRSSLTLLFFLLSGQLHAQFFSHQQQTDKLDLKARSAMQQGNYAIAYCIWEPLAQQGNSSAQYNIGWMYHNGYGLSINDEKALNWWLKSATTGDANSHYALGDLYSQGLGVEKNLPIALGWYISAALKGHEPAKETLMALLSSNNELAQNTFQLLLKTDWSLLGDTMQVNVDKANTRRGPDKSYKVVATLERGHNVIPLREQNGWTYIGITHTGKTAWIFSRLISKPAGIYPLE